VGAPDYAAPFVGWRGWLLRWVVGELRLCSPMYETVWEPARETSAVCRAQERWASDSSPAEHAAPAESCRCGIYACTSPVTAASFVSGPTFSGRGPSAERSVFGRVSLWGTLVECERGWRAAYAYPALLYVPDLPPRAFERPDPDRPSVSAAAAADALGAYRVPVELIAGETVREIAEALEEGYC
jgi:hypothetical protein